MPNSSDNLLKGAVALVTGGGSGIGRGIARAFAAEGAAVAILGRKREKLDAVVAEIGASGGKALALAGDVSKSADAQAAVRQTVEKFGKLTILVNNAGVAYFGSIEQTTETNLEAMLDINLKGCMLMSKHAVAELARHGTNENACILNIGTSAAQAVIKHFSVYSAAKAGMNHFTQCLARDLAEQRVRVNCINPGVVETPIFEAIMPKAAVKRAMEDFAKQTPLGRVGQPEDIAEAAVFLCSRKAAWITGALLTVDGGISLS